jgi:hypothetical protein
MDPDPSPPAAGPGPAARTKRLLRLAVFLVLVGVLAWQVAPLARFAYIQVAQKVRFTPVYDPPVLAGQVASPGCSGGVYARTADGRIVITTTGHCSRAGDAKSTPSGRFLGHASASTNWAKCDRPGKDRCTGSDMAYIELDPSMIPWGHLDLVDFGIAGYRTIAPGTRPLLCPDIPVGARVEHDGNGAYRTGKVLGTQAYDFPEDGTYFPCLVISDAGVMSGDSGGLVLVNGMPGGVNSRWFPGDYLGFTPLAEGLAELGLTMCDSPDCGVVPPATVSAAP